MNQQPVSPAGDTNNVFANPSQQMLDPIYKKIMWRIIPFIFVLWMLAWIDRVNVGFAKLQMQQDLGFSETVYGIGAGIFFLGYFFWRFRATGCCCASVRDARWRELRWAGGRFAC